MAKKPAKGSGTSKVRFIMLEAEMPEGDLSQITTAIQNALKPATLNGPRPAGKQVQMISSEAGEESVEDVGDDEIDYVEVENTPADKPARARRPAKRTVLDIDLESDVSLRDYAEQYPPKTDKDRFLVSLSFFKEHRPDIDAITADHLFTCFKAMDWPSGQKDFTQPLRQLKKDQYVNGGDARGTYVINHVGEGLLKKLTEK